MRVAFLGTGLIFSVGSAGKSKNKAQTPITFYDSRCSATKPDSFKQMLDRYSLSCRYNGGTPTFKYVTKGSDGGVSCSKGSFFHGIEIGCDGAKFKPQLVPPRRRSIADLPKTPEAKAAMIKTILDGHNLYRASMKLKPLTWHDRLAQLAEKWAGHLGSLGGKRLVHSTGTGQGENLWMGAAGTFDYAAILKSWSVKKEQRAQMMNPKGMKVGCAFARAGGNDILVCRYWPPIK